MATTADWLREVDAAQRPLTDNVFDALREAVVVVDAKDVKFPVLLTNSAAERCFAAGPDPSPLTECSLSVLLGPCADSVVEAALVSHSSGAQPLNRVLPWRFRGGEIPLLTELKILELSPGHPLLMLTFPAPQTAPALGSTALSSAGPMPLDLLILDQDLTVRYASAGACRIAGCDPQALQNLSALVVLPTSAIPREALTGALEGRHFHDDSIVVLTPGATTRWFDVDVQPLFDQTTVVGIVVLSLEITERRLQRRPGAGGDKRLFALTEFPPDVITVAARDGHLRFVSGVVQESLGYAPSERLSHSIFDHIHPDDVAAFKADFADLEKGLVGEFSRQLRLCHKNSSYRWVDLTCTEAFDNPFIRGVLIGARDLTDRKLAEARLRESDDVFKLAAEAVNGTIFEWDLVRGGVRRFRGVAGGSGSELEELVSRDAWSERIHPQDRAAYESQMMGAMASGRGWTANYRIRTSRGQYRHILERGLLQRNPNGDPVRAIGCAVDVSDIARLTDLLAEALRIAKMGGWEYNFTTREFEWTEELGRVFESGSSSFKATRDSVLERCTEESRARVKEAFASALAGDGDVDMELELYTLMDRRIWVRLVGHVEKLEGAPVRAYGSLQNIQAQKQAQIALENSTDWLKLSMTMAQMNAWRWDRNEDTLEFAIVDGKRVGQPKVVSGMKWLMARLHPKDRPIVRSAIDEAFERRHEVQGEFRIRVRGDRHRVYTAIARPLFDAANRPIGLMGVTEDVTDRRESQARLRRSQDLLRTTTSNVADTLILLDLDLRICFINRGVGGLSADDLVGESYAVVVPEGARVGVTDKLNRVLMTGEPQSYEFEVNGAGGDVAYYENRAVVVREDGAATGISITVRDITERKRLEQEILDVVSRERQAIGRDLHDGLGQNLTGVALLLRGLATRLEREPVECGPQINEIMRLVNQSIHSAHELARGLMPVSTDGGGLAGALHTLADHGREVYGLEVECRVKVSPKRALPETTANHLYRIAQEALTNTARHARATKADIYLLVTAGKYVLRISDNGAGMGDGDRPGSGMGLKIMKHRASMIGATIEIVSNHPHGTMICVTGQRAPAAKIQEAESAMLGVTHGCQQQLDAHLPVPGGSDG
jgi:PAS domain S-box-containing protein